MKSFFLSIFIFLIFGLRASVHDRLQTIPEKDQIVLEQFFRFLLCENEFGYTLFGQKPISITITTFQPSLKQAAERMIFEKGWETWAHYRHLFPSDRFVLKRDIFGDNWNVTISLINKPLVYKQVVENLEIFQKFLGADSPETICQKICEGNQSIFDLAHPHPQALVGILLGYGKSNAINFQKESEIFEGLSRQLPPLAPEKTCLSPLGMEFLRAYSQKRYALKTKIPCLPSILKDLKEIFETRRIFLIGNYGLEKFDSPKFACWENEETQELRKSYAKTRAILREVYKTGSILENTLNQWMHSSESSQDALSLKSSH